MFDKITIIDSKIAIVKYIVKWECASKVRKRWVVDEKQKNQLVETLNSKEIDCEVIDTCAPKDILKYHGYQWGGSRKNAIEFINKEREKLPRDEA